MQKVSMVPGKGSTGGDCGLWWVCGGVDGGWSWANQYDVVPYSGPCTGPRCPWWCPWWCPWAGGVTVIGQAFQSCTISCPPPWLLGLSPRAFWLLGRSYAVGWPG
ncbi:hypothetical protein CKAH01_04719 [Colletotrichum kahawae]|uniref:Uncharacterized protein n=1 Tax=Colletotrichum kahawae TaxID=34407 RepID=A0AAD9YKF2_COLKA|nr:hypothetical protein CKAH01_04719 [Colletotrichum kahawae]